MKTKLGIKNFRVFDENGVTIELNPITILTGCNSSGKSSIAKALLLLDAFLSQIKKDFENHEEIRLSEYKFDFNKYPFSVLGRYNGVLHEGSHNKEITMEYTIYSNMISKDVNVELVFAPIENDQLNNGYLSRLVISTTDGVVYSSDRSSEWFCNLNILKEAALEYLPIEYLIFSYCGLYGSYEYNQSISEEEFKNKKTDIFEYLKQCDQKRKEDTLKHVRSSVITKSIVEKCKVNPIVLEKPTTDYGSIFVIPVIEKLNKIPKSELKAYIDSILSGNNRKEIEFASRKIVDDYIASDRQTFGDYFFQWESNYLSHITNVNTLDFFFHHDKIKLLNLYDCAHIIQNYLPPIIYGARENSEMVKEWEARKISFEMIYEVVMAWNEHAGLGGEEYYTRGSGPEYPYEHYMLTLLSAFASEFVQEVMCPQWCGHIEYISSDTAKVRRLFALDSEDSFSELLKRYFDKKSKWLEYHKYHPRSKKEYEADGFINRWIGKGENDSGFNIGSSISIEIEGKEGLGVYVYLVKNDKKHLIANEGFGITQLIKILLNIETAILSANGEVRNPMSGLEDLGGYSADDFTFEVNTIVIEEPEIHLHPALQSKLADMMVEAYNKYNIHFIIETHSEYLIRKSQVLVSKMGFVSNIESDTNSPFKTYYVPEGGKPYSLGYRKDGKFAESFGSGFYDEAAKWAFKIL